MLTVTVTILIIIVVGIAFWHTADRSIKHNKRIINWLKQCNDKSGRRLL
jgi:hypothetical protein